MTDYQRIVKMIEKAKKNNPDLDFYINDGTDGDFCYITLIGDYDVNSVCLNFDIHGNFKDWE